MARHIFFEVEWEACMLQDTRTTLTIVKATIVFRDMLTEPVAKTLSKNSTTALQVYSFFSMNILPNASSANPMPTVKSDKALLYRKVIYVYALSKWLIRRKYHTWHEFITTITQPNAKTNNWKCSAGLRGWQSWSIKAYILIDFFYTSTH